MTRRKRPPTLPLLPKFKSQFESLIYHSLIEKGAKPEYEVDKLKYIKPASNHTYHPDFKIKDKVYIEAKGLFTAIDRKKMLLVKEAHPDCKIYLCFQNANMRLSKQSKTTYAMWAEKNGFEYCHAPKGIPEEWIKKKQPQKKKISIGMK